MELGIDILAMLFAAAFIAAFIDAIAGGGGFNYNPCLINDRHATSDGVRYK